MSGYWIYVYTKYLQIYICISHYKNDIQKINIPYVYGVWLHNPSSFGYCYCGLGRGCMVVMDCDQCEHDANRATCIPLISPCNEHIVIHACVKSSCNCWTSVEIIAVKFLSRSSMWLWKESHAYLVASSLMTTMSCFASIFRSSLNSWSHCPQIVVTSIVSWTISTPHSL